MVRTECAASVWIWDAAVIMTLLPLDCEVLDWPHTRVTAMTPWIYFGHSSLQLLPQQWVSCQTTSSTSSGTQGKMCSDVTVESESFPERPYSYKSSNPSHHWMPLISGCSHNCICYSRPAQAARFDNEERRCLRRQVPNYVPFFLSADNVGGGRMWWWRIMGRHKLTPDSSVVTFKQEKHFGWG